MSRMHLSSLALLLVATFGLSTEARSQDPVLPTDSAVADSVAPKKKGRFGGLMDKAKQVAGNKSVQNAAKGVACTVVPGAAVVSATTGAGPCANSGLVAGIMNSAANGGAAAIASGALSGAALAAAQATAMKSIQGRTKGMSGSAAAVAAMQALQAQGMSSAQAASVMSGMLQNPAATGMSVSDVAAAMKMIQSIGMSGASSAPATSTAAAVTSTTAKAPPILWTNYDFVPGERVLFYSDFSDNAVGNFPERLQFVEGNMDVVELGGRRMLRSTSLSKLTIPLPETLPQRFTIEIDVTNRPSLDGAAFHLRGSVGRIDDPKTSVIGWGTDGVALLGGGGGEVRLAGSDANRARYRAKPAQLRIHGDGKYIKVYLDEKRLANVPNANFERSKVLHLVIDARSEENPAYVSRIRVAESRKSMYDEIAATGRAITHGLVFESNSERLRPESISTLKYIATMLETHPELRLRIEGHTDDVGSADANLKLSERRAAVVKTALVADHKVNAGRLEAKGFGSTKPASPNTSPEGRAINRRVELVKM